jgi:hypothetical protein
MRSNVRISAPLVRSISKAVQRRNFSASLGRQTQYGFIGLGQMGKSLLHTITNPGYMLISFRLQYGKELADQATFDGYPSNI